MKTVTMKICLRLITIIGGACLAFAAEAAGLGALTVQSALGQPLAVEIEVTSLQADEFARVVARIAIPEDYEAARLTYTPLLRQLRITPELQKNGRAVLRITSVAPINEPSLDLLVEFNWRGGRLLQKYSVLLDPPK